MTRFPHAPVPAVAVLAAAVLAIACGSGGAPSATDAPDPGMLDAATDPGSLEIPADPGPTDTPADPGPGDAADATEAVEDAPPADIPPRTTPGGLPLELPFRYERPAKGTPPTDDEIAASTKALTGFWKKIDYFTWATDTSAGMDVSTGYPDYLIWWHDFVAVKEGDLVTFRASAADGGSHNNAVPTGVVLGNALTGYLASGDPAMRYATAQYTRSLTACMKGFVHDAEDPIDFLIARHIVGRNHAFNLPDGRKKAVDYTEWYFAYEGWNADRFRYPDNPTWGDIWVTNKRSKDDLPYWWRVAAWLPYAVELAPDASIRADAAEALDLLRKSARDIVESGWWVRTKDADGNVYIPEDQDLASFVNYVGIFPDAECDARLSTALLGYGEPKGVDCGSGEGSLYDAIATTGHYFNYDIIVHFHMVAALLALTNGQADAALALVQGLATRLERYQDPASDEAGHKDASFDRDIAMWLLRSAAVGLPLTADEARRVLRFSDQSVAAYADFPNWNLWAESVPDGTYSFRDGFHPAHRPEAFAIEDLATVIEYCASPFRNPAGVRFIDCDVVLDPQKW